MDTKCNAADIVIIEIKLRGYGKNMTINELAETIGYSSTYTRNIVNGKIVSATVAEKKINDVLGIR